MRRNDTSLRSDHALSFFSSSLSRAIFDVETPSSVWYGDGVEGEARQVTSGELEARCGFRFREGVWSESGEAAGDLTVSAAMNEAVHAFRQSAWAERLVVRRLAATGHALFAREAIAMGSVVCLYSGELRATTSSSSSSSGLHGDSEYECSFGDELFLDTARRSLDARLVGGLARFIQHCPTHYGVLADKIAAAVVADPPLAARFLEMAARDQGVALSDATRADFARRMLADPLLELTRLFACEEARDVAISWERAMLPRSAAFAAGTAWANLQRSAFAIDGQPVVVVFASRPIARGELLGMAYGLPFWCARATFPHLFASSSGAELSRALYNHERGALLLRLIRDAPANMAAILDTPLDCCTVCAKVDGANQCCARCKIVFYCGKVHQRAHWPTHKLSCQQSDLSNIIEAKFRDA